MKQLVIAITCVLSATFFLEIGSSLLGIVQPIRALLEGFTSFNIASLGTAYYSGFIMGCLFIPRLIKRFGHIRTFSALAAITGSVALLNAFIIDVIVWFLLRMVFGFCMAGLYTVIESWLNELATPETRGRILAGYMMAVWFAVLSGKLLFTVLDPSTILPFALISIVISLSLVPVALTTGIEPERRQAVSFRPKEVFEVAPVGIVTCFLVGMANGTLWILAPVYAQIQTQSTASVGIFMASIVLGGALAQWPVGRLSDRIDRRLVILASSLLASAFGVGLAFIQIIDVSKLFILAFGFGAAALPLYSLCIAHVNDKADPVVFVEVSGQLLLISGLGAIFGPLIASICIDVMGPHALFIYTAAIHALIASYALWRAKQIVPVPQEAQVPFTAVPQTTPLVFEMQPTETIKEQTPK